MLHSDLSQLVNSDRGARFLTEENGVIANCFVTDEQNSILGLGFSQEPLYMCLVVCVNSISYIRAGAQQTSRGKKNAVFFSCTLQGKKNWVVQHWHIQVNLSYMKEKACILTLRSKLQGPTYHGLC